MYFTQQFTGMAITSIMFGFWQNNILAALFMAVFLTFLQFAIRPSI